MMMAARPWLALYDEGVPRTLEPYPELTLLDLLSAWAREQPDDVVAHYRGARLTARRLERVSNALAAGLARMGIGSGDRVALLLPNCPQFLLAQFAVWKAGASITPLDPLRSPDELAASISNSGARAAVVLSPYYQAIKGIQSRTSLERIIVTRASHHRTPARRLLSALFRRPSGGARIALAEGDVWLKWVIEQHLESMRPDVAIKPDDVATVLSTAGTTGPAKWVPSSHRALVASGMRLSAWLRSARNDDLGAALLALPLTHVAGLQSVLPLLLMHRIPVALVREPDNAGALVAAIARLWPSYLAAQPGTLEALLDHPHVRSGRVNLRSLTLCVSVGKPLSAELRNRFQAAAGCRIIEAYGLAEGSGLIAAQPHGRGAVAGSTLLPLPDINLSIADPANILEMQPVGEVGEILLNFPQQMSGYWRTPASGSDLPLLDDEGRRWIRTGDVGSLGPSGELALLGRAGVRADRVIGIPLSDERPARAAAPAVSGASAEFHLRPPLESR
jgi:long-chain acyl-CoA synthetase